jgi:hypothetical protein
MHCIIHTFKEIPPRPLLLKTTALNLMRLAEFTKHLIYSAWLSPVNPGRIIIIGALSGQPSYNQSSATCPPSLNFKISLKKKRTINNSNLML